MSIEHVEIRIQPPPAPIQHHDDLVHTPSPEFSQEKIAPADLLLMGMMLWMDQGMVLDWLRPKLGDESEEKKNKAKTADNVP